MCCLVLVHVYMPTFLIFCFFFFFFNDTATTEIYTLSLHDALPISIRCGSVQRVRHLSALSPFRSPAMFSRSEEHTSELQSRPHLVCRLLLEKKKQGLEYVGLRLCTDDRRMLDTHS